LVFFGKSGVTLTDFDCVREHALNTIDPGDQVARSGWVGLR
jgi:hypothetical protein